MLVLSTIISKVVGLLFRIIVDGLVCEGLVFSLCFAKRYLVRVSSLAK